MAGWPDWFMWLGGLTGLCGWLADLSDLEGLLADWLAQLVGWLVACQFFKNIFMLLHQEITQEISEPLNPREPDACVLKPTFHRETDSSAHRMSSDS